MGVAIELQKFTDTTKEQVHLLQTTSTAYYKSMVLEVGVEPTNTQDLTIWN